jgi:hypothetical protein
MASVVAPTHVAEAQVVATAEAGAQANHPGLVAQHLDPGRGLFLPVQGLHQKGVLRQAPWCRRLREHSYIPRHVYNDDGLLYSLIAWGSFSSAQIL